MYWLCAMCIIQFNFSQTLWSRYYYCHCHPSHHDHYPFHFQVRKLGFSLSNLPKIIVLMSSRVKIATWVAHLQSPHIKNHIMPLNAVLYCPPHTSIAFLLTEQQRIMAASQRLEYIMSAVLVCFAVLLFLPCASLKSEFTTYLYLHLHLVFIGAYYMFAELLSTWLSIDMTQ